MPKGQPKSNREIRKPKKDKSQKSDLARTGVVSAFATPTYKPGKKR